MPVCCAINVNVSHPATTHTVPSSLPWLLQIRLWLEVGVSEGDGVLLGDGVPVGEGVGLGDGVCVCVFVGVAEEVGDGEGVISVGVKLGVGVICSITGGRVLRQARAARSITRISKSTIKTRWRKMWYCSSALVGAR